jgi:small-conductance mechanosensitive channel
MQQRRITTKLGVTYNTSYETLRKIPELLRSIVDGVENATLERVHFANYGESALIFEMGYFVPTPETIDYMDVQQEINFRIYEEFSKAGIEFAFPTQTVYLHQTKS